MFGNALFNPSIAPHTPGRRHSHLEVSLAPKIAQRRATSPVINIDGMSPGLGYMHAPSTPCFVTPTLGGFSGRRFSYDSPLQTLTSLSSGGLPTLNRKAAKHAWATMSTKKLSRPCKMVMIMLLTSFAITLFLLRKSRENSVPVEMKHVNPPPCNEHAGTCDVWEAHQHENNLKEEFMGITQSHDTSPHMDTSWHENDGHVVQHPEMLPNQGFAQEPQANMPGPPQPGHMQPPQVGSSQPLHPHGQAPAQQQYHNQGMQLQQPTGHLRPPQPQVIGVPAHHMPQQQYAHGMPNAGQPLPPGVNHLQYNQYPQPHNQYPQPHYNHNQGNIIGHNPQHHQNNWGQKLPPGVNPNHYRGL